MSLPGSEMSLKLFALGMPQGNSSAQALKIEDWIPSDVTAWIRDVPEKPFALGMPQRNSSNSLALKPRGWVHGGIAARIRDVFEALPRDGWAL